MTGKTLQFSCINEFQELALAATERHQCYSGGYGNGKSTIGCVKSYTLCATYPKYRVAIIRKSSTDLRRTTMATFFKWCPPILYDEGRGGKRVDSRNYLRFCNGSEIFWLHLDDGDDSVVRGLEVNSIFIDQAEEITEGIYDHANARVDRWDMAELPGGDPNFDPKYYQHNILGAPILPAYMMIGVNPDSFEHWVYKRFHHESPDYNNIQMVLDPDNLESEKKIEYKYSDDHKMYHGSSTDNAGLSKTNIRTMLQKDEAFVNRFVKGIWGIPGGAVHMLPNESVLDDIPVHILDEFMVNGTLYRSMDHGYSDATCVLWFSVYKQWTLCYREYYESHTFISDHRTNIHRMSNYAGFAESYRSNIADPDIFKKRSEKAGAMWCVADEYSTIKGPMQDVPPIHWTPGDNNELMTRNQINEMIKPREGVLHPVTGEDFSPMMYFLKRSPLHPFGCINSIAQLKAQKKLEVAVVNGEPIYSDERDPNVTDHGYDPIRYFVADRPKYVEAKQQVQRPGSFDHEANIADQSRRMKVAGKIAGQGRGIIPQRYHA